MRRQECAGIGSLVGMVCLARIGVCLCGSAAVTATGRTAAGPAPGSSHRSAKTPWQGCPRRWGSTVLQYFGLAPKQAPDRQLLLPVVAWRASARETASRFCAFAVGFIAGVGAPPAPILVGRPADVSRALPEGPSLLQPWENATPRLRRWPLPQLPKLQQILHWGMGGSGGREGESGVKRFPLHGGSLAFGPEG